MQKYNREELHSQIVEVILQVLVMIGLAAFSFYQILINTKQPEEPKVCKINCVDSVNSSR